MKKLLASALVVLFAMGSTYSFAQGNTDEPTQTSIEVTDSNTATDSNATAGAAAVNEPAETIAAVPAEVVEQTFHEILKEKFIEGGWEFMGIVTLCLIFGLAFALERIINLNLNSINTEKFLVDIDAALASGGVDGAKELCKNTRGPIASIFYQGFDRAKEGLDVVEKSVVSYGSVQMGQLEKGMVWISLFIALAPMLGFMGTVIGMVDAFDAIQAAGDIDPSLVARGIKVALLTTLAGLIVAIILQVFYNYIVSKIDATVNGMEDASITLIDLMIKHNVASK